jgi:S-adenosylmethionine:tRNA ribosyltransferase-isomerase
MMRLEIKGVEFAKVNLNIGLGSFRPVEVEDLTKHKMDSEHFSIQQDAADIVNNAKNNKKKVLAVGSSVMRALESSVSAFGMLNADDSWTDKFIFPPYEPRIANCYLTNFHEPQSTLMMLTSAYLDDHKLAMEVYNTAVKEGYNFLCYGDALLIK